MRKIITTFCLLFSILIYGQIPQKIEFNKDFLEVNINISSDLSYQFPLKKNKLYEVSVLQQGVDVVLILKDEKNNTLIEKDSPNGNKGLEKFQFKPTKTSSYTLTIKRLDEDGNPKAGNISIKIKQFTKSEIQELENIKKELEVENKKTIQTIDIDHFWQAFDNLKKCTTRSDSIASFQKIYLNRATDGLKDFIDARKFTAEKFVDVVSRKPKFFRSVRKNTYEVKKVVEELNEIVINFKRFIPILNQKKYALL